MNGLIVFGFIFVAALAGALAECEDNRCEPDGSCDKETCEVPTESGLRTCLEIGDKPDDNDCSDECQTDVDCPADDECCKSPCGNRCEKALRIPTTMETGRCPPIRGGACTYDHGECIEDNDCPGTEKCCPINCGTTKNCAEGVVIEILND
ncbi:antileukoproteinase-like [Tubulanus polymorphus]|uniref:antileukoproteinase-like n=1 Tax=Tubulanus polymorphus TaxID=672921 RepID=UPI003DA30F07